MAAPLIGVLARFAGSLSSGMGRMSTMAGGAMARGAASEAGTFSSATSNSPAQGVKIISKSLDKFIGSQKTMNKLNSKSNEENMKYMSRFEMSMRRTERLMYKMNKYSLGMNNAFTTISNGLAGIGLYQILSNKSKSNVSEQWMAKVSNSTGLARRALAQVGEANKIDLLNFDAVFGALSKEASIQGSDAWKLFNRLHISPNTVKNLQGIERIGFFANMINRNKGTNEIMSLLSSITGKSKAELLTLGELDSNKLINEYYQAEGQINESDLTRLSALEKRRIERANEMENAMDRFKSTFSGFTNWWEDLWNDIKVGMINTVIKVYNGIATAWNNIAEWWNNNTLLPGTIGKIQLGSLPEEKNPAVIRAQKAKEKIDKMFEKYEKNLQERQNLILTQPKEAFDKIGIKVFNYKLDLNYIGKLIDSFENRELYSTEGTIGSVVGLLDAYFNSKESQMTKLYGKLPTEDYTEISNNFQKEIIASLLKNSLGWNDKPLTQDQVSAALKDLESGTNYKNVIVKIYQNSYDINSQPATYNGNYK